METPLELEKIEEFAKEKGLDPILLRLFLRGLRAKAPSNTLVQAARMHGEDQGSQSNVSDILCGRKPDER
jgi:hypothetical protein